MSRFEGNNGHDPGVMQAWLIARSFYAVNPAPWRAKLQASSTILGASQPHLRQTCPAPHTKHLRAWRRAGVVTQRPRSER
jgi:hypothetical protein